MMRLALARRFARATFRDASRSHETRTTRFRSRRTTFTRETTRTEAWTFASAWWRNAYRDALVRDGRASDDIVVIAIARACAAHRRAIARVVIDRVVPGVPGGGSFGESALVVGRARMRRASSQAHGRRRTTDDDRVVE